MARRSRRGEWVDIDSNAWFANGEKIDTLKIVHHQDTKIRCAVTDVNKKTVNSNTVSLSVNLLGNSFMFYVEDVFGEEGNRVATGRVLNGKINTGDTIYYIPRDKSNSIKTTVSKLEIFRKVVDSIEKGDSLGIYANYTKKPERGDLLTNDADFNWWPGTGKKRVVKGILHIDESSAITAIQDGEELLLYVGGIDIEVEVNMSDTHVLRGRIFFA